MRRFIITIVVVLVLGVVIGTWQPFAMRKEEWIRKTAIELQHDVLPTAGSTNFWPVTEWVLEDRSPRQRGYLIFSNGWASLSYHTIHNEGKVGDAVVLRSKEGAVYVSDFHFCGGLLDFSGQPQPRDLEEFIKMYEPKQHWKKDA